MDTRIQRLFEQAGCAGQLCVQSLDSAQEVAVHAGQQVVAVSAVKVSALEADTQFADGRRGCHDCRVDDGSLHAQYVHGPHHDAVPAGSMLILVICRPAPDADQARFGQLLAEELAALRRLKVDAVLTQAWSPGRPGAVLMLDVPDVPEATRLAAALPLAAAGLITTEIIPLHPLEI